MHLQYADADVPIFWQTLQGFPSDSYDFNDLNDALEASSLSDESWDANESLDIVPEGMQLHSHICLH